jgi:riboflavin synthase
VAVDGVCLTVVEIANGMAAFDVSRETLQRSVMGEYAQGTEVNLEKALLPTDRLGGHFVQGHVDGVGRYIGKTVSGENIEMEFEIPADLTKYVVHKGSISINGASLTAARLDGARVTIAVIPHTLEITCLSRLKPGDKVNIECDVIAKYVEKLILSDESKGISVEFLKEKGFL